MTAPAPRNDHAAAAPGGRPDPVWADRFFRVAICAGLAVLVWYTGETVAKRHLWDLQVYREALAAYRAGGDPYRPGAVMAFVYPPWFLAAFAWTGAAFAPLLLGFYAATLALLARPSMRTAVMGLALLSLTVFYHSRPAVIAIASGNLTFFLHALIILAWQEGGRARRRFFPVLVVLAASLKPYFLAYLVVPVIVAGPSAGTLARAGAASAASAAIWAAQYLAAPQAFAAFVASLRRQSFLGDEAMVSGDIGWGFYRYLAAVTGDAALALVLHAVLAAVCVAAALRWRGWLAGWSARHGVDALGTIALSVALIVNPRLKIYDYCWLGALAAYLVAYLLRGVRKAWLAAAWLILHFAEKPVGPDHYRRFMDSLFLTVLMVVLLARSGRGSPDRDKAGAGCGNQFT